MERLRARGIRKRFGGTLALDGAELSAGAGEVHAVLGENGAGKSTLIKILAGVCAPDEGSMTLDGVPFRPRDPQAARRAGVAVVYQEPLLCPDLTVAENVLLGAEPTRFALLSSELTRARAEAALSRVRAEAGTSALAAGALAADLSPGAAQLVAIARALAQSECRVLILDEPTSSLTAEDTERLFRVVRELSASGLTILYISHFLEEVLRIADRYTVLRDGRSVESGAIRDVTVSDLVTAMAGQRVDELFVRSPRTFGEVVLEVSELSGAHFPKSASLELRRGEVLGIAGLVGSGRTALLRTIFGLGRVKSGRVRVAAFTGSASPARRLAQGMGLLSENRKGEGLAEDLSIADNLTLSNLRGLGPLGLILPRRQDAVARTWIERLGIRTLGPRQAMRDLSGGNQQKVAFARLLHHGTDVALLDEPTRGIDVRSRAEIYRLIDELARSGKAVLMVSSYFPELLGVCDRIAVMRRGVLEAARPARELDEHQLITEASGAPPA